MRFNITFLASLFIASTYATTTNTIDIFQNPTDQAKVIGTINPTDGVTILPNNWVKVKDSKTHTEGWVKQEQIQKLLGQNNVSVNTTISSPGNSYQTITEIHTITQDNAQLQKRREQTEKKFKQNMQYFNKIESITNSMFDNMFSTN